MGASVKPIRSKAKRRAAGNTPEKRVKHPLDQARGFELIWPQTSPLLDASRLIANPSYVYFVGEEEGDGPVKVGVTKKPIERLRTMQTGNPRRLKIEHILIGDREIEQLLHEIWEEFAIRSAAKASKPSSSPGTEWFKPEIRDQLYPVLETAAKAQLEHLRSCAVDGVVRIEDLQRIIREAHGHHGVIGKRREPTLLLGAHAGYVNMSRRSRV